MSKNQVQNLPHSWELLDWPAQLWPHDGKPWFKKDETTGELVPMVHPKVRWLVESKKKELMKSGALVRPGRTLVILGPQYLGWLQQQVGRVKEFEGNTTPIATAARMAKRKAASQEAA
jgi:hypothetical protein